MWFTVCLHGIGMYMMTDCMHTFFPLTRTACGGIGVGICVLTDLYRFGINAENVLSSIHGGSYILADFLSETVSELSPYKLLSYHRD